MHVTIGGKRWRWCYKGRIGNDKDGICEHPATPRRQIVIRSTIGGQYRLEVELHEMLHAEFWDLSEESVSQAAKEMAEVLWRIGYRMEE